MGKFFLDILIDFCNVKFNTRVLGLPLYLPAIDSFPDQELTFVETDHTSGTMHVLRFHLMTLQDSRR